VPESGETERPARVAGIPNQTNFPVLEKPVNLSEEVINELVHLTEDALDFGPGFGEWALHI
jgi:hypothetical protein